VASRLTYSWVGLTVWVWTPVSISKPAQTERKNPDLWTDRGFILPVGASSFVGSEVGDPYSAGEMEIQDRGERYPQDEADT
jgi:hypothetical protein